LAKIGFYDITVLALLHQNENLQVKDVCKELGVAKSTMTSILKRLESSEYLVRRKVEHDGRGFYLGITEKGTELLKKHEEFEDMIYMHILGGLNEEESSTLIKLLFKGCGMGR
jgi:DNA-binding MarR family transcriptional regulator